jgi:hypothetical protein
VIPVALAEEGVLTAPEQQFVHPTIITKAMAQVRAALVHRSTAERPETVARQLTNVDAQLERVSGAVQNGGGKVGALVERMRRPEQRRGKLLAERDRLRSATGAPTADQLAAIEKDILARLDD